MVYSYGLIDTLTSAGGVMSFNDPTGDTFHVDPERSTGLEMPKVRPAKWPKGQANGNILGRFHLEGLAPLLAGDIVVRSVTDEAAMLAKREEMCVNAVSVLSAMLASTGTLAFVGGYTLACKCEIAFTPTGKWFKSYVFGLVSESAT